MLVFYLNMIDTPSDREKFTCIFKEYRYRMKYIAMKILENEADAEDALQDSFEKLIKVLPHIQEPVSDDTAALLTVIVKNTCYDLIRRRNRYHTYELEEVDSRKTAVQIDMLADINVKAVWSAIERLPARYRDVLLLKHYFDLSPRKIAEVLGISTHTVYKRLERAKQQLQADLKKEEIVV